MAAPSVPPGDAAATGLGIWLRQTLVPGAVMIDVGANVGHYSMLAAEQVTPAGHVYAFEPAPENVRILRQRFDNMPQVSVVEAAVGGASGLATFFLDRREHTRHSLAAANTGKRGEAVTVPQVRLDDYLATLHRLDVVKIDAQGAEFQIIQGARQLLAQFHPCVVLELWPFGLQNLGGDARQLLQDMRSLGYVVYRLSAKGRVKHERFIHTFLATASRWNSINVLALPPAAQHAASLRGSGRERAVRAYSQALGWLRRP